MSDTKELSPNLDDQKLTFTRVAFEKLLPPEGLFDDRVPVDENTHGLFLPVIVCKKNHAFVIIDGCKRYKILKARGQKDVACGIIETAMSPAQAGLLRIELNSSRQLHAREKLLFIGWLKAHLDQEKYHEQAEKLRLPANERHEFEQILGCKPWLIEAVMQGTLDPAVAPEMDHLSESDAGALINLFSLLSFSRQMQRELAEWLPEIAFIRKISLKALLASETLSGVIIDTRLNDPQKTAKIHDHAHAMRFPLYTEAKKNWTEYVRKANPDPSVITFHASPYFEKNALEIRIKAADAEKVRHSIRQLAAIDPEEWRKLVDPTASSLEKPPIHRQDQKQ